MWTEWISEVAGQDSKPGPLPDSPVAVEKPPPPSLRVFTCETGQCYSAPKAVAGADLSRVSGGHRQQPTVLGASVGLEQRPVFA